MITINSSESSGEETDLGGITSAIPFLHQEAANPSQATNYSQRIHVSDDEPAYGPGNDIGTFLNKMDVLNDEKRFQLLTEHFMPSEEYHFLTTLSYGRSRKFQLKWL